MTAPTARAPRITREGFRLACIAAQGLPAPPKAAIASVLDRHGFLRTLGGIEAYLALRARVPGLARADVDDAIAKGRAQVVPSVRGCIYMVPRDEAPVALRAAELLSSPRDARDQAKAGVRKGEVEKVAVEALAALKSSGPLTTDALRRAMPEGAVRSLGEAGKKVGLSSPLPGALRRLEFEGKIGRVPEGGRLDTERYLWKPLAKSPFEGARVPEEPADLWARLGAVFFAAAGLATVRDFAAWAGIPQRDAKAAAERLDLVPVEVEDARETYLALEDSKDRLLDAAAARGAAALLPFEDNLVALRGGPSDFVDPAHHRLAVPTWGSGKPAPLGEAKHLAFRCAVAEGRVAGFWEYDPDRKKVVLALFDGLAAKAKARLGEEAAGLSRFIADDLGHGRSFSLDTDDELRKRVGLLAKIGR